MGNWNINIQGVGPHHNHLPYDVEVLTREFIDRLRIAGHSIEHVTVTAGSKALDINPIRDRSQSSGT